MCIRDRAYINQAAITGESIPESKSVGDVVYSGSIVESGYLLVEAVEVGEDTTFARILRMVEEAQDKKAKSQKFLEKFSRYYTPAVIVLAVAFYFFSRDIRLALTLLAVSYTHLDVYKRQEQGRLILTIDVDLGHHREGDTVIDFTKSADLIVRTGVLTTELITRETEHDKVSVFVFLIQVF